MYIGPERQLVNRAPDIISLVDKLHRASRVFAHTRDRDDLRQIILIVQELNSIGYLLIWDRRYNCVGAHRRDAIHAKPN